MKKTLIVFMILLIVKSYSQQNNFQGALYNVGFGGLTGGIGAVINKKSNEKTGKVFLKGFYQGALGGAVVFGSKKMVYNFHNNENLESLWMAKIVNSAGVSIIENAATNRNFWEKWHLTFGFNRLEYDIKSEKKFHYKLMPLALVGTVWATTEGKFNLKYSLQSGTPVFLTKDILKTKTLINSIIIEENQEIKRSLGHETIHVFQYEEFLNLNMFFDKKKNEWQNKSNFLNKTNKWIYMDLPSGGLLRGLYLLENINKKCYFDNYFENEANFYSNQYKCSEVGP
jgi:hypothetical protein